MANIAEERCIHGGPTILSPTEFDALGADVLYRGLESTDYIESYCRGSYRATSGLYGQGIYFLTSSNAEWALKCAHRYGQHVMQIAFTDEAVVMPLEDLENQMSDWDAKFTGISARLIAQADQGEAGHLLRRVESAKYLMSRAGFFGLATGIDAYYVRHDELRGVETDYYIVLNRTVTAVRSEG